MCRDPAHNSHCSQNFLPRSTSCPQSEPLQQQSLWKHRMGSSFPTNWLLGLTQVDLLSQIRNLVSNNLAGKMYEQSSLPDFKNLNGSKSTWELKSKRYGLKLLRPRTQNFETPKLAFYFCICLLSSVVLWVAFSWQIPPAHCQFTAVPITTPSPSVPPCAATWATQKNSWWLLGMDKIPVYSSANNIRGA